MRVEVTFAGDSVGAQHATDQVADALKKLLGVADATGHTLAEVKITSGQAAETAVNARRMQDSIAGVGREARQARRDLEELKLTGRTGVGVGPFGSGFGRVGLLGAAIGAGTLVSGPTGAAALGGLAALPGLAAAGGAAVGVLALSFHGLGKAVDGNRQAFEKLDPAAQQFVQTLRSLDPWVDKLALTARQGLFPGLTAGLHSALTPANAAAIQTAIGGIASSLGDVGKQWGKSLGSPQFTAGFAQLMTHSATWTRQFGDAADHLAGSLGKLTVAALPLDDWLVRTTDQGAKALDNWIAQKRATGELGRAFDSMRSELEIVARFFGALGHAVFSLARALTPLGNEILVAVTRGLQDLSRWIDTNRQGINDFATGALHALETVLATVWPLLKHVAEELTDVAHAVGGWQTAFEIVLGGLIATKILAIGGAAVTAAGEVGGLRLALLALASPEVLAALGIAAAAVAATKTNSGQSDRVATTGKLLGHDMARQSDGTIDIKVSGTKSVSYNPKTGQFSSNFSSGGFYTTGDITAAAAAKALGVTPAELKGALGTAATKGALAYPLGLVAKGNVIGTPFQGTHGVAFNVAGGSNNWESENAVDIAVKVGTPVIAVEDGTIGPATEFGALNSLSPRMAGLRLHLIGDSGNEYYYAHLSQITVKPGQRVKKGDVIGKSGSANGVAHLHFAQQSGNPMTTVGAASQLTGTFNAATPAGSFTPTTGPSGASPFGTPPPFTATTKVDLLPANLRLAMAKAATTGTVRDDIKAAQDAAAWLRVNMASFSGEDLINAYNELGALIGQIKSLEKPAKKKRGPALATHAAVISAETYATGLLKTLATDAFAATTPARAAEDTQKQMRKALDGLAQVAAEYKPKIQAIQREISKGLADKTLTAADLATLRARMGAYQQTITSAVSSAKQAVAAQQASFQQVWQTMASDAVAAFNAQTDKFVPPSQVLLNKLQDQKTKEDLQFALEQANKQMADALNTVDNQAIVDSIRGTIGRYTQALAVDQVQSQVLGGASTFGQTGMGSLLNDLQAELVRNTVPDAEAVKAAQKAIDDAQLQIKMQGLAAQAKVEQDAYSDMRNAQLQVLQQMGGDWANYYNLVGGNINAIKALWVSALSAVDPTAGANLQSGVDSVGQDVGSGPSGVTGTQAPAAAVKAAVAQAAKNAASAARVASFQSMQTGLIRVARLEPLLFHAAGGVATGPVRRGRDVYGEAGAEAILPLTDPQAMARIRDAIGTGDTIVELHGDAQMLQDFIDVRIRKRTPQISSALGQRTAARLRSHTY